jgi:hypothetical protein
MAMEDDALMIAGAAGFNRRPAPAPAHRRLICANALLLDPLSRLTVMKERAEILRDRIALYRRHLAEGVDADAARQLLEKIMGAQAELTKIEKDTDKRE